VEEQDDRVTRWEDLPERAREYAVHREVPGWTEYSLDRYGPREGAYDCEVTLYHCIRED
jgi:hypothetical protein